MINIGFISCSRHLSSMLYVGVPGSRGLNGIKGSKGDSGGFIQKFINDKEGNIHLCLFLDFLPFLLPYSLPGQKGNQGIGIFFVYPRYL